MHMKNSSIVTTQHNIKIYLFLMLSCFLLFHNSHTKNFLGGRAQLTGQLGNNQITAQLTISN